MAKSLTDLLKSKPSTPQKSTQQSSIPTDLYEYVGSNTDDLYVIGHKGNVPVKIKVRANSCCDGIDLGNNAGGDGGIKKGRSFDTFNDLRNALELNLLSVDTIYDVTDKGTIEQYIYTTNENGLTTLEQIGGNFNMIVSDPGDGESICPLKLEDGTLHYNLPELVIGDFLFKGWKKLTSFISDTPALISGNEMFQNTSLRTFYGELSSLENAEWMFGKGVKLDYDSILNIVDSIKNIKDIGLNRVIHIGYDSTDNEFIKEKVSLTNELTDKGWTPIWLEDGI